MRMHELCVWVREQARGRRTDLGVDGLDVQNDISRQAAEHFNLCGREGKTPVWLNRVIEGIIGDVREGKDEGV